MKLSLPPAEERVGDGEARVALELVPDVDEREGGTEQGKVLVEVRHLYLLLLSVLLLPEGVHQWRDEQKERCDEQRAEIAPQPECDHHAAGHSQHARERHAELRKRDVVHTRVLHALAPADQVRHQAGHDEKETEKDSTDQEHDVHRDLRLLTAQPTSWSTVPASASRHLSSSSAPRPLAAPQCRARYAPPVGGQAAR